MMKWFTLLSVIIASGIMVHTHPALADMTPKEILARADQARGNAEGVQWRVKIEAIDNGRRRSQTLRIKARNFNVLAETLAPPKVKGRKLVMRDRNMWFVRPGLRKPVPISPRQRLLGGASNADIASTDYAGNYAIVRMAEAAVDGEPCYVFDLKAIDKKVSYDRITYWISKARLVGVQAEFYTVSGRLLKSASFAYDNHIEVEDRRHAFVSRMVITDAVVKDNVTTMTYSHAKVKTIPESTFNLNLLLR